MICPYRTIDFRHKKPLEGGCELDWSVFVAEEIM